jgi:hypothetical protein
MCCVVFTGIKGKTVSGSIGVSLKDECKNGPLVLSYTEHYVTNMVTKDYLPYSQFPLRAQTKATGCSQSRRRRNAANDVSLSVTVSGDDRFVS